MPIETTAVEAGVPGPPELTFLDRVFHEGIVEGETYRQREARASRILAYYTAGITDKQSFQRWQNNHWGVELVVSWGGSYRSWRP